MSRLEGQHTDLDWSLSSVYRWLRDEDCPSIDRGQLEWAVGRKVTQLVDGHVGTEPLGNVLKLGHISIAPLRTAMIDAQCKPSSFNRVESECID